MIGNVKILNTEVLSNNWYTLRKITYEYQKNSGDREVQSREAYDRGNGATILLYNKENKSIILTRQFRLPTFINGNESGMLIEACAGLLDKDNPEDCVRREAEEETGYKGEHIQKVFEALPIYCAQNTNILSPAFFTKENRMIMEVIFYFNNQKIICP